MKHDFQLFLFTTNPQFASVCIAAGVAGIIVDWENKGKKERQDTFDTQINYDTYEDLVNIRRETNALIICRINSFGPHTLEEVNKAIEAEADEILLPMVRHPDEVSVVLKYIRGRCKLGILIETEEAISFSKELGQLNLSRVYIGLNDLSIQRKSSNIFLPLVDGTISSIRKYFDIPFGLGGLTLPELGRPIPCHLLMQQMTFLDCNFSFLRRSFTADTKNRDIYTEVPRIYQKIEEFKTNSKRLNFPDDNALASLIHQLENSIG